LSGELGIDYCSYVLQVHHQQQLGQLLRSLACFLQATAILRLYLCRSAAMRAAVYLAALAQHASLASSRKYLLLAITQNMQSLPCWPCTPCQCTAAERLLHLAAVLLQLLQIIR
jgi:hypothetical protein